MSALFVVVVGQVERVLGEGAEFLEGDLLTC